MAEALIYIPDISGFTKFVNNTEISHAQHIISELLEVIIDSNKLDLEVSEVEGDAILFYKETVPQLKDIFGQARETFLKFHQHLRKYESERVCECGACKGTPDLTLKMIAHSGEIGFTKVKNMSKPFGGTLVEAHRLLKNSIEDSEYLLVTDALLTESSSSIDDTWIHLEKGSNEYDGKNIDYTFTLLKELHNEVQDPPPIPKPLRINNPVKGSIVIEKPLYQVFEMVNNLDFRLLWRKELTDLQYDPNELNRAGSKHRCLFDGGFVDFESIKSDFGDDALVYGEKVSNVRYLDDLSFYYILTQVNDGTRVNMEAHIKPKLLGWLMLPFIKLKLKRRINSSLEDIKDALTMPKE